MSDIWNHTMKKYFILITFTGLPLILTVCGCKKKSFSSVVEQVMDHYGQSSSDSLKLRAAKFILANVNGFTSLDPSSVSGNTVFYNYMEKTAEKAELSKYDAKKKQDNDFIIQRGMDDILDKMYYEIPESSPKYLPDTTSLTADFLIKSIDEAFLAREKFPWAKNVPFDIFKEYVLPYRVIDTYWSETKPYFISKYKGLSSVFPHTQNLFLIGDSVKNNIYTWYKEDGTFFTKYPFLLPTPFENIMKNRVGDCYSATALRVSALRAVGIPAAYETIPQWGNLNTSHFFYKIIDPGNDTIKHLITNANIYRDTKYIVDGSSYAETLTSIPTSIPITYNKTIPKIYRKCFSFQRSSLAALIKKGDEIPPYFQNDRLLDVTQNYIETAAVNVPVSASYRTKYAYLCVFNPNGWTPVAWSMVHAGHSSFKNMGKNIVYLPAFYENGQMVPAGYSFLLKMDGTMQSLKPTSLMRNIQIRRKFRFSIHTAANAMQSIGGRFQGANQSDLSDSVNLYKINEMKYDLTTVPVTQSPKFRYYIFQFNNIKNASIAEVEFWGIINGKEVQLKGKIIGNKGLYGNELSRAFDNKRDTYFVNNKTDVQYIGIDLAHNKARLTKIKFCPRNDSNNIQKGDIYELFYWDNNWISLGKQKGVDLEPLNYKAPTGCMFWLKDKTKGSEERIFTYENGEQLFW